MNIGKTKKKYFEEFGVDMDKALDRTLQRCTNPTEGSIITSATELLGEKIMKKFHILDILFPDNIGYNREHRRKWQKAGIDYWVHFDGKDDVTLDLKVNVGKDYNANYFDYNDFEKATELNLVGKKAIPLEIYQGMYFTNTVDKPCDYILYIVCEDNCIWFACLPYKEVSRVCYAHRTQYRCENGKVETYHSGDFVLYKSNNGSGTYIRYTLDNDKVHYLVGGKRNVD